MITSRWCIRAGCERLAGAAIGLFVATASLASESDLFKIPNSQLETVAWSEIDGWATDDQASAFATYLNSCKVMVRGYPAGRERSTLYAALQSVCRRAISAHPRDADAARAFFEANFRPMRITPLGESSGFLTGYYEPIIEGSRIATDEFKVPIYRTPPNLALRVPRKKVTAAGMGNWRRFARRDTGFYYDRTAIEEGALSGRNLEICWLKDPTDLFFAQIQGSVRVKLADGTMMRLNYDSQNGWPIRRSVAS
jgi:membrane-bound lytic murein transglycosylase A